MTSEPPKNHRWEKTRNATAFLPAATQTTIEYHLLPAMEPRAQPLDHSLPQLAAKLLTVGEQSDGVVEQHQQQTEQEKKVLPAAAPHLMMMTQQLSVPDNVSVVVKG